VRVMKKNWRPTTHTKYSHHCFFFLVHKENRNIRCLHFLFVYLNEIKKDTQEGVRKMDRKKNDDTEEGDK
jgi:hypothetical protein